MVEGTPLLRVQTGNRLEGSNPFVSASNPPEQSRPDRRLANLPEQGGFFDALPNSAWCFGCISGPFWAHLHGLTPAAGGTGEFPCEQGINSV